MKFRSINSRCIVKLEGVEEGKLKEQISKGGIHLVPTRGTDLERNMGIQNRWAEVISAGPKCTEVEVGDRVCIYSQKWTESMKLEDLETGEIEYLWATDEEHIMLIDMLYRETNGKEKTATGDILNLDEHLTGTESGSFKIEPKK